jgi:hypothetical protein
MAAANALANKGHRYPRNSGVARPWVDTSTAIYTAAGPRPIQGFLEMTTETTVILEAGFEGGSLTMLGIKSAAGWRFQIATDEGTTFDLLSDEDREGMTPSDFRSKSDWVDGWEATLALLNERRYWHMMSADRVHPEFRQRIWTAVQDSFGRDAARRKNTDPGYERICRHQLERWRRVCRG